MEDVGGVAPRYPALYRAARLAADAAAAVLLGVDLSWPGPGLELLVSWAGECQGEVTRGPGLWLELGLARGKAGLGWGEFRLISGSRIPLIPMDSGGRLLDTKFASFLLWLLLGLLNKASAENGEAFTSNFCEALVVVVLFSDKSIVISDVGAIVVFFGSLSA